MRTLTVSHCHDSAVSALDQRSLEFLLDGRSIAVLKQNESAAVSIDEAPHDIEVRLRNMLGTAALGSVSTNDRIVSGSEDVCVESSLCYGKMKMRLHVLTEVYPFVIAVPDHRLEQVICEAAVKAVQSESFRALFNDRRNERKSVEVRCRGNGIEFAINNSGAKLLSEIMNDGHNIRTLYSFASDGYYLTAAQRNNKRQLERLTELAVNAIIANTEFRKDSYHPGRITTRRG